MRSEASKQRQREYRESNRERLNAAARERYAATRELRLETMRAWQSANREKVRQNQRSWYAANKERVLAQTRAWVDANPEKARAKDARYKARAKGAAVVEVIDRAAIIARDKQRCHLCGGHVPDGDVTLDHIIPLSCGGDHTATNLAVAHRSCNCRKGARPANEQLRLVG
jgi:hypothetical protein